jgi:hypothetical protein
MAIQKVTIDQLKEQWKADRCWDIERTEGFEEQRQELYVWRLEFELREARCKLADIHRAVRVLLEIGGVL